MNTGFAEHERVAIKLAKELEEAGYSVVTAPTPNDIPFSLDGYVPDLVATKGDDKLIIEIKSRSSPEHAQRYRKVIDAVESHPGWRFLIQTISDSNAPEQAPTKTPMEIARIEDYLGKASRVIALGTPELSFPFIWNAIIGLLRIQAAQEEGTSAELSDRSLINQLYTLGVISQSDYEHLVTWYQLRNEIVHSMTPEIDVQTVKEAERFACSLVETLKATHAEKDGGGNG